jgi:hypothetical protein
MKGLVPYHHSLTFQAYRRTEFVVPGTLDVPMTQEDVGIATKDLTDGGDFCRTAIDHESFDIVVGVVLDPVQPFCEDRDHFFAGNKEAHWHTSPRHRVHHNDRIEVAACLVDKRDARVVR